MVILSVAAYLLGAAVLGVAGVRRVGHAFLHRWQQGLWGLVLGWIVATAASYGLALWAGRMTPEAAMTVAGACWLGGLLLWLTTPKRASAAKAPSPGDGPALLALAALLVPLFVFLWGTRMLAPADDGLYSGGSAWADVGFHSGIAAAFRWADNFPPVYPILPDEPLRYPFLPDFQAAVLMALGASPHLALTVTAVPLALAGVGLFYFVARRLTGSRAAGVLASLLFLFHGGWGLVYFRREWLKSGQSLWEFWTGSPVDYSLMWADQIYFSNVLIDTLLPQRASLYGFAVAWMVLDLVAAAWVRLGEPERGKWPAWRLLAVAGTLTATLPFFHSFSYMALGLLSVLWFLLRPQRVWLAYWLPALLLAIPQFGSTTSHVARAGFMKLQLGWMAPPTLGGMILFWLLNLGTVLLLAVPAWSRTAAPWHRFYLAFVGLLALSLIVSVSPHEYNNLKLMYYWLALTCTLVSAWLLDLARRRRRPWLASVLALSCVATGLVSVHNEQSKRWRLFDTAQVQAAEYVRAQTPHKAVFLTGLGHDHPVFALAGRRQVLGYPGWVLSHGYATEERERGVRTMFQGGPEALALLRSYGVDYVYVGEAERQQLAPNLPFFEARLAKVYASGGIAIYQVP